ncbi:protein-tyrosine phosphatase family protein [Nocardia alni]|uniref:protein-tyrosine phosphatase family protein n=1 Tax=Nocardia alni TaxID=2815723 RepID=UPI001C22DF6C|nr:dual specificity protein phosphatase family protein [Nocardia alni]
MRIKNPGPGAEFAETPWNEIVPGLFMGGHHRRDESGDVVPVVVTDEFDVVISLYSQAGHGPGPGVQHHIAHMPDDPLTSDQLGEVSRLADIARAAVSDGKRVLVRCHAGYNRSGLITAQTLHRLGYSIDDAIFLVRYRRSKYALNNSIFVDYLTTGIDVARLLTGLET